VVDKTRAKMNNISEKPLKQIINTVPFSLSLPNDGIRHFPILDSSKSIQMSSALVTLQPGENIGSHNTGMNEELLIILEGIGEVEAQGVEKQHVSDQSVIYISPGNKHNVRNVGSTPLRYIYVVSKIQ
jgi:mannose-6-phosphate isomerase-like protein (cupin superfamily)